MNEGNPPRQALRFLSWFCPPKLFEGIEGDLREQFAIDVEEFGAGKARRRFTWNVFTFFRPGVLLRNKFALQTNHSIMLRNYVKVASRNIAKRKLYSFINAVGLSIGIAFCLLIYLFIQDEKSFDQFHFSKDRIFRLEAKRFNTGQPDPQHLFQTDAWMQLGLRQVLKEELPEVERTTRFNAGETGIFRHGDKVFSESFAFVDDDFFGMFSFPLLAGNRDKIFKDKLEAVITPAIAQKYFGSENPLGKTITVDIDGEKALIVTGIIAAPPANSSLDFSILIPQENRPYYQQNLQRWGNYNSPTFVQLLPGTDVKKFGRNLNETMQKYVGERLEKQRRESPVPVPEDVLMLEYVYTGMPDIHLKKEIDWAKVSDPRYAWILGGIAVLILAMACINYISLALTSSAGRRMEVGVRKVVGAQKNQIIYQFGLESILLSLFSMVIGIMLAFLFLPYFNDFTGKDMHFTMGGTFSVLACSAGISVAAGMIAGSYPALFLSSIRPSVVLRGGLTSRLRAGFTKPLVVVQFALSAFLIIISVIMYQQMRYITTKDLGYHREQILVIPTQTGWNEKADQMVARYRARLSNEPAVLSVAGTTSSFNKGYSQYGYEIDGQPRYAYVYGVDPYYLTTIGAVLSEGRNFDGKIKTDSAAVIVNEALVRDMQWKDPLNEYLNWRQDTLGLGAKVIGVVKDYHFFSLEHAIEPMFLSMDKKEVGNLTTMLVKVRAGDLPSTVKLLYRAWNEISPNLPFDYSFLDEDVARQYESYARWMNIMGLSTGFAVLISCLGLFGLAGINAVNRTKEIGIRKVMGAAMMNIFVLLNKQYLGLSAIAFVIAAPAAWYAMKLWLADFQFAIEMRWELFALSLLTGLFIALTTVSYHAIRAAMADPTKTLKYE